MADRSYAECRHSSRFTRFDHQVNAPESRSLVIIADHNPCGTVGTDSPPWHLRGVPINYLLIFRIELGRPVVDKTGLTGPFNLEINWTPRWSLDPRFDRSRFPDIDVAGPDIFTAVQEQLGLKFVSEKDEEPVLLIDHVEQPTPN